MRASMALKPATLRNRVRAAHSGIVERIDDDRYPFALAKASIAARCRFSLSLSPPTFAAEDCPEISNRLYLLARHNLFAFVFGVSEGTRYTKAGVCASFKVEGDTVSRDKCPSGPAGRSGLAVATLAPGIEALNVCGVDFGDGQRRLDRRGCSVWSVSSSGGVG